MQNCFKVNHKNGLIKDYKDYVEFYENEGEYIASMAIESYNVYNDKFRNTIK